MSSVGAAASHDTENDGYMMERASPDCKHRVQGKSGLSLVIY
jgi:hypothetical protein